MKRTIDVYEEQFDEFIFDPPPEGQEDELMSTDILPVIDNEEVVDRYMRAKLEFREAHIEVKESLFYVSKEGTPAIPCSSSCLHYEVEEDKCKVDKTTSPDRTCNYYYRD